MVVEGIVFSISLPCRGLAYSSTATYPKYMFATMLRCLPPPSTCDISLAHVCVSPYGMIR